MAFDREELDDFLIERGCVGFFDPPIVLKSGRRGDYYINIRDAISTQYGLRRIANFVYDFTKEQGLKPDQFIGVPEGATPIGVEVTSLIKYKKPEEIPLAILRAKAKDHGDPKDRYSVGPLTPRKHAVVVEDVSTTGGSGEPSIMSLQESGVIIDKFLSVASRLEKRDDGRSVEQAYRDKYNVSYASLTDVSTLLPKAVEVLSPSKRVLENIEKYFAEFCILPIKLLP
jgi:orotate phosphoribosyltransferase